MQDKDDATTQGGEREADKPRAGAPHDPDRAEAQDAQDRTAEQDPSDHAAAGQGLSG